MIKTKTQTKTNAANAVTLTNPYNTVTGVKKVIFLKSYLVAAYGSAVGSTDLTIQITNETGDVLWEDVICTGAVGAGLGPMRASFEFPGKGLPSPPGENLVVTVAAGAANESTECSVVYDI